MSKRGRQDFDMPSISDVAPKYRRLATRDQFQQEVELSTITEGNSSNQGTESSGIRPNLGSQQQNSSNFHSS